MATAEARTSAGYRRAPIGRRTSAAIHPAHASCVMACGAANGEAAQEMRQLPAVARSTSLVGARIQITVTPMRFA